MFQRVAAEDQLFPVWDMPCGNPVLFPMIFNFYVNIWGEIFCGSHHYSVGCHRYSDYTHLYISLYKPSVDAVLVLKQYVIAVVK